MGKYWRHGAGVQRSSAQPSPQLSWCSTQSVEAGRLVSCTRAHPSHCHHPDTARHPTPVTRRLSSAGVTTRHRHGDQCASDDEETPHQLGTSLVCYQLRGQVMVVWMVTPFTVVLISIAPRVLIKFGGSPLQSVVKGSHRFQHHPSNFHCQTNCET